VYPKILEKTDYVDVEACVIDVGLMHTTLLCIRDNSVIALETFPFGTNILMDALADAHPELTLLQIEHMLSHQEYQEVRSEQVEEFLSYIVDTLRAFLESHVPGFSFDHVFCAGGVFDSADILKSMTSLLSEHNQSNMHVHTMAQILETESDRVVTQ
jgi:Tfp pilus assembly PilM family ATPase